MWYENRAKRCWRKHSICAILIVGAQSVCDVSAGRLRRPNDFDHLVVLQAVVPGDGVAELNTGQLRGLQSVCER